MKLPQTEDQFQTAVIDLARTTGWMVAHFRPARTSKGYRTPVSADGAGFPDLVLAHHRRGVMFVELKADDGDLEHDQRTWLSTLRAAGATTHVWRPADWDHIEATLTGTPPRRAA